MSYAPAPHVVALLDRMRPILNERVLPLEARLLQPGVELTDVQPELDAIRAEVSKQGLLTPQMGTEWGGLGLSNLEYAHIAELLGCRGLATYRRVHFCHAHLKYSSAAS